MAGDQSSDQPTLRVRHIAARHFALQPGNVGRAVAHGDCIESFETDIQRLAINETVP